MFIIYCLSFIICSLFIYISVFLSFIFIKFNIYIYMVDSSVWAIWIILKQHNITILYSIIFTLIYFFILYINITIISELNFILLYKLFIFFAFYFKYKIIRIIYIMFKLLILRLNLKHLSIMKSYKKLNIFITIHRVLYTIYLFFIILLIFDIIRIRKR